MKKVLLVDDDLDMLKIVSTTLSSIGYEIEAVPDILGALEKLNHIKFDVLITDANMPLHSGYELVQSVRSDPRFDQMAITMFTGRRNRQDIEKALKLGVDDYIVKPFDPAIFLKKIEFLAKDQSIDQSMQPLASVHAHGPATIELDAQLETLSEVQITLTSKYPLEPEQIINVKTTLFDTLHIQPPALKVLSSTQKKDEWHSTLTFIGVNDSTLQKIRAFIYKQSGRINT